MKKRVNDVFEYLLDKNINTKEKEEFVNKKTNKIIREINKQSSSKIMDYLFNRNLPNSVKVIISEEIDKLPYRRPNTSELNLEEIKMYIDEKNIVSESILSKEYYPNILKEIIIDKIYNKNILKNITDKSIDLKNKKIIIDLKVYEEEDIISLLKEEIPIELTNYIIDTKVTNVSIIQHTLSMYSEVSSEIKDEIIKKKINSKNIVDVLYSYLYTDELVERILDLKKESVAEYINKISNYKLLKIINLYKMQSSFSEKIIELRKQDVENKIKILNTERIIETLLESKTPKLTELILNNRKKKVFKSVSRIYSFQLLSWLENKYISDELKEYTVLKRNKDLNREIKKLTTNRIKLFYLNKTTNLPISVQKKILELKKNLFKQEIKNYTDKELIEEISYGTSSIILREFMIQEGINEKNILNLLYELEHQLDLAKQTLNLKKDIIGNILRDFPNEDIFNLYGVKVSTEIANLIIEVNKDVIIEKLNNFDKKTLIDALSQVDTLNEIKKIILEKFDIKEADLVNCLQIINEENCELLINNYSKIKSFFAKIEINFETFMQYGSGSKKYNNWILDVVNIINNNKIDEFIALKNYFFSNYYNEELEQENTVYIIENFLELLQSFSSKNELCMNILKQNKVLTKEEKQNIAFIFKLEDIGNLDIPKNLDELNSFKLNLYKYYINLINNKNTNITELKDIFYDLIFYNAEDLLSLVGGTRALKTLKKDNCNSKYISGLIDELLLFSNIIDKVNSTNNKVGLVKVLKYIFKDDLSNLTRIQNIFLDFENKLLKLYELDSQFNLTQIKDAKCALNSELSLKYGGEVYDLSDKNYVLYGHALSYKESMDNLVNGASNGSSNFISVSPISYLGQKYYYNIQKLIVAFDKIPTGSFVCSSISNMGSNYSINKNSYEVKGIRRKQRGILETSAVIKNNSEALLYREDLKPCGLILPGGKTPNKLEMEYHEKYKLPFIITQKVDKPIDTPKKFFDKKDDNVYKSDVQKELQDLLDLLEPNLVLNKETYKYTGREIALFTDCHSMYEPTAAVLDDINKRGITEIYSLGDNVGLGPNPEDVFDLLEDYDVKSVAGNSEYYNTIGLEPFNYFYPEKIKSQEWTFEKLGTHRINKLKLYPPSLDIIVGNKKVALCHFANDVRWDYVNNSTWTYQANFDSGNASKQFLNTNSEEAKKLIENYIVSHKGDKRANGFISAKNSPLFDGKIITDYDSIIQGHVHFEMNDKLNNTNIHTLRALAMGYKNNKEDKACYYILKERKDGSFDIEKKLVDYNKNRLISNICTCGIPEKEKVLKFVKGK